MQIRKRSNKITSILIVVACFFAFLIPVSFAYFYDQYNLSSESGTIGQIKLGAVGGSFTSNLIVNEGGNILSAPISLSKDSTSANIFARIKVSIDFTEREPVVGDVINGVELTAKNIEEISTWVANLRNGLVITPSTNSTIISGGTDTTVAWRQSASSAGYGQFYYLTKGTSSYDLYQISSTSSYKFCDPSNIVLTTPNNQLNLTGASGTIVGFQHYLNLKFNVKVEVAQSDNIEPAIATVLKWESNFN